MGLYLVHDFTSRAAKIGGSRQELRAALNSAKIQMIFLHGMCPCDWPRCVHDAQLARKLHGEICAGKTAKREFQDN
jgi:hypothetical protein